MKIHISLTWLILLATTSYAQNEITSPPDPLFTFTILEGSHEGPDSAFMNFAKIEWLPDSRSFRFPYVTKQSEAEGIYYLPSMQYFLDTNELLSTPTGDCLLTFSRELAASLETTDCARMLSPDGRYTIYETNETRCGVPCIPVIAVVDLETGNHHDLHIPIATDYFVRWSEGSQGFLVFAASAYGGGGGIYHVSSDTLNGITELGASQVEHYAPEYPGFVDISPDGWQVLVRGDGEAPYGLRLWDAHHISTEQWAARADGQPLFKGQLTSGAAFLSGSPNELLVVLERGIVRYNIETQEETLINPNITATEDRWVHFSPDEQYALVYDGGWYGVPADEEKRTSLSLFRVASDE